MTARIAILTGRSDPARTGLPPVQAAFLAAVAPPGAIIEPQGYPYTPGAAPEGVVPLPLAIWRNARIWHAATRDPAFGRKARASVGALRRAGPVTVITGSCGLDILVAGWGDGPPARVIALGPVLRTRPALAGATLVTVIGRGDWLARLRHRQPPDHRVPCGHMGYWSCPATRALVAKRLSAP